MCFTYAIWYGIEGLVAGGEKNSPHVKNACKYLVSKQKADGSWGETFQVSIQTKIFLSHSIQLQEQKIFDA